MSTENELTPEQQFNKILGEGALEIKRLEQLRDNPPGAQGPSPKLVPPGAVQGNSRVNKQDHENYYNDAIGNKKAEVLKQTDALTKNMPQHVQKGMKDKALTTMYPLDKVDPNQVKHPAKAIDNSQENVNYLRAAGAHSRTLNDQGKAQPAPKAEPPQNNAGATRFTQLISNEKQSTTGKQPEQTKADSQAKTGSMSTRFTQSLTQNQPKADTEKTADKTTTQDKGGSMSTRFTQSLIQSNDKAASSTPGKSIGSMSGKSKQSLSKD